MKLGEAISGARRQLAAHKLRSALSMLGIVFGVGAVIAMLAIGAGGERQAQQMIERLGARNVLVRAKSIEPERRTEVRRRSVGVSPRDGEAIRESIGGVTRVVPRLEVRARRILADGRRVRAKVHGVSAESARLAGLEVEEGRFLDARDEAEHADVCVIGSDVRRDLFGGGTALGRDIRIDDAWFEVVGVFPAPREGSGSFEGVAIASTAGEIHLPWTSAARKLERDPLDAPLDELVVELAPGARPSEVAAALAPLIARLHGGADDFEVVVPEALLEQSRRTRRLFNIVMGSIAGISLLVGGIGIMNIMLASVLERVREIGVRRAVGATKRDIRTQFVVEAFAICALGGGAGLVFGLVLARVVSLFAGWPTIVSGWSLVLSTGVAVAVGLVSGIYPATRAANLDPIEALRWE